MGTRSNASPFPSKGDRVAHGQYGPGTITELDVFHTVIDFDAHGIRRFVTGRAVLEPTSDPGPTPSERRATTLRREREERSRKRAALRDAPEPAPAPPRPRRTRRVAAGVHRRDVEEPTSTE